MYHWQLGAIRTFGITILINASITNSAINSSAFHQECQLKIQLSVASMKSTRVDGWATTYYRWTLTRRRPWPRVTKLRHLTWLRSALAIATLDQVHVAEMLALALTLTCRRIVRSANVPYFLLRNIDSIRVWLAKQAATRTIYSLSIYEVNYRRTLFCIPATHIF